jgi:uncharacterized membrane protein
MDGFSVLIAIAAFVLGLVALHKMSRLETRVAQLRMQIDQLLAEAGSKGMADQRETVVAAGPDLAPSPPITAEGVTEPPAVDSPNDLGVVETFQPSAPAPVRDMEQTLASRWFVWIGGIAIAIGGLLFVKYAYDNGLIPPTLQIILGILAGAVLVAAGELIRRKGTSSSRAADDYVPAALSAAGLAILFASIFAAYALYEVIGGFPAFIGLAAVALGALALSRWQGPFIAALGLLGSYVTPALIPSAEPSAWGFFAYLLIILAASFAVLRGRNWWWLGYLALAGAGAWGLLWIKGGVFVADHVWPVGLFSLALGMVGVFGLKGRAILDDDSGRLTGPASMSQPLVIALAGLAVAVLLLAALVEETRHAQPALMLMAAAALGMTLLAWFSSGLSPLAPIAGLLMLIVLMAWPEVAFHSLAFDERGFWSSVPGPGAGEFLSWMLAGAVAAALVGVAGSLRRSEPLAWAVLAAGGAFFFTWGAWARADLLLSDTAWSLSALAFAAILLVGAWLLRHALVGQPRNTAAGVLAAGAAALLVFALDRHLDGVWLTLAIAVLAAAYAAAARSITARLMGGIAAALGSLTALRLFLSHELWSDDRNLALGQHWVIYGYGIPVVLFLLSSRWLRAAGHARSAVALEGISLGLAISLVSLEIRVLIGGGYLYDQPQFLELSAHILTWLGAAYGLMHRQRLYSSIVSLWGSRALIALSVCAILGFTLFRYNPALTEEPVAGNMIFNALLLGYLAPAVLIGLIAQRLDVLDWQRLKPAAGVLALVLAFVYVTLQTKRIYQGPVMMAQSLSPSESYAYSAVWLAFALGLFVAGIRLGRQFVRLAGLGVMALVVVKVFIADMSNLEGLFRIASFVGLGLCLVGIGWLYQRFVQQPARSAS